MAELCEATKAKLIQSIRIDGGKVVANRLGLNRGTLYDVINDVAGDKAVTIIEVALNPPPTKTDNK